MPRRNYRDTRRRPHGYQASIERLAGELGRYRRPAITTDGQPTNDPVRHYGYCTAPNVGYFTGRLGDSMARCHTCRAVTALN